MAVWEIGKRAVERGEISEARDICMLFGDELTNLASGQQGGVTETVDQRQAHHSWLQTLEPPFIINGEVPPNTEWPKRSDATVDKGQPGDVLVGNPGCPGVYRGRARVILDPLDPTGLNPGDILVAPMTDPAWTPLFVTAGAVVVDVGAALSHAIIVSRELGIPCVVSATDATGKITDGAEIEVNGDTGVVTLL
jgi:pyruvate,water dikinase